MQHRTMPSVSVVIPSYNASGTIQDAVATARAQTHRPMEIIVVDDASTDDTVQKLREIAGPDLVVISRSQNAGGGAARNRGIERASGDLIAFLDADDLWASHKLATQLAALDQQHGPAFCFSAVSFTNEYREQRVSPRRAPEQAESLPDFMLKCGNVVQTSSILAPRGLLDRCRFTESLRRFQDIDFVLKLDAAGVRAVYVAEPLVEWRTVGNPGRVSANASPTVIHAFLEHHAERLTFAQRLGLEIRSLNPAPGVLGSLHWCWRVLLSVCMGALPALHALSLLLKHSLGVRSFGALRNRVRYASKGVES
jgi:glycosyltransferase involved in cell wall biosynthesis